jgi:hypothetical protein
MDGNCFFMIPSGAYFNCGASSMGCDGEETLCGQELLRTAVGMMEMGDNES